MAATIRKKLQLNYPRKKHSQLTRKSTLPNAIIVIPNHGKRFPDLSNLTRLAEAVVRSISEYIYTYEHTHM